MSAATVVEIVIVVGIFVGLLLLCHFDPGGYRAAEIRRRQSS